METISRYLVTFLLNALWQMPLVAAVAALGSRLMRNGPAAHRHAIWVAALIAAVLLPVASVRTGERTAAVAFQAPSAPQLASSNSPAQSTSPSTPAAPARRTVAYAQNTAQILLAAYALFFLFRVLRLSWAWFRTVQIRDAARLAPAPAPVRRVWDRCLTAFGLRDVELLGSPGISSPVAAGAWRRSIILPETFFAAESEEVLTTAIGHEMAHLARHDFALKVLYEVLYLPIAFHPACWLILRGIEETREMACDELVTHKLLDAGVYARSIVTIAASMTAVLRPGYTLGVFDGDILEQRIRRLLHRPAANLKRARLLLAAGLSALALCVVISSGVALTARAQSVDRAEIASRVKAAQDLMEQAMANPKDAQIQARARQSLLDVLSRDPANQEALNSMMILSMVAKQPLEGRQWALRMVALYPKEKTSYYSVGFTDWSVVYPRVMEARAAAGMRPEQTAFIADAGARRTLRESSGAIVDEGIHMLETTLQMDPEYSDAMAYMNLLYRLKANIAETEAESNKAVALADEWVGKALDAKRKQPAATQQSGAWTQAPPPPPPPPPPPEFSATALASEAPMPGPRNTRERTGAYWQVVGASPMSAKQLIGDLKIAGFPAGSAMTGRDKEIRVIVGPYPDDASLAEARTKLESAGYRVLRSW
jgi:beta-lactamase regulating signal transducer with metallopeptidase domain